ncbi:MAG TPA: exodeoxyribonuclease VII large subunit, partial [Rhizomicrobium sp.]|nr:exodeoxyribonuclease VII large subunit [Rhizomicrobium sp.]
ILPRTDQLLAPARQRFDLAAERLGSALNQNLREHRRLLIEAALLLRPRGVTNRIEAGAERVRVLAHRLVRCQSLALRARRDRLDSLARLLDSVSHRSVLERGFALVRGADGAIRRCAATVVAGEALSLVFADSTIHAKAQGRSARSSAPRRKTGQADLF